MVNRDLRQRRAVPSPIQRTGGLASLAIQKTTQGSGRRSIPRRADTDSPDHGAQGTGSQLATDASDAGPEGRPMRPGLEPRGDDEEGAGRSRAADRDAIDRRGAERDTRARLHEGREEGEHDADRSDDAGHESGDVERFHDANSG